jgi:FAD:protein FMN transferase
MLILARYICILFLLPCLSACDTPPQQQQHSSLHFGTLIDITLHGVSDEQAVLAFEKLDENFAYLHGAWSPWEAGSLSRTNRLIKTQKKFTIGPSILPLIEKSAELSTKTNGLFNPAIGELINLWQIHRHDDPDIKPPADKDIQYLIKQNPKLEDLKIDGIKIRSENPTVALNFGAFAKGYAIDLQMKILQDMGIKNAIINTGGDLKAIGSHGGRPWHIAIRHPRINTWLAKIETKGEESIFTSGDYERFYIYKNKRYHHILDPRTGYPTEHTQSVTVIHTDSGLADAAATALFVAGPEKWLDIAANLGLKQAMLIDQNGIIHVTPAMHERLIFNPKIETTIKITAAL